MALVAMMKAHEVRIEGHGAWHPCVAGEDGARAPEGDAAVLFPNATWVRFSPDEQSAEHVVLHPVYADSEGRNKIWAVSTPSGVLELHIHNPRAFGQVKAGRTYRVTVEEVRGPRPRSGDKT